MEDRICEFCGLPFSPRSHMQRYCKRPHYMNCPVCGKRYLVTNNENLKKPPVACSYECRRVRREETSMKKYGIKSPGNTPQARKKAKETMQERYGVDYAMQSPEIREKSTQTLLEKYGVDNAMKDPSIREKAEATCVTKYGAKTYLVSEQGKADYKEIMMNKYGVLHPLQSQEIQEKYKSTCQELYGSDYFLSSEQGKEATKKSVKDKYGVDHITQAEEVKEKIRQTCLERYQVDNASKNEKIKKKITDTVIKKYGVRGVMDIPEVREKIKRTNMERYGVPYYIMQEEVQKLSGAISKMNLAFQEKLSERGIDSELEKRIESYSFDFYLPEFNMLVDLNPSYTHSLIDGRWITAKPVNYHLDRCKKAHMHNYTVRCIFDWDSKDQLLHELVASKDHNEINDFSTFLLNKDVGISFLSQYGRARVEKYPNKMMIVGAGRNDQVYQAIAVGQETENPNRNFRIIDYGTKWGYKLSNGYDDILRLLNQFIDLDDLHIIIDSDCLHLEDIRLLHLTDLSYTDPKIYWSRSCDKIECTLDNITDKDYIDNKWLPVADCGRIVATISDEFIQTLQGRDMLPALTLTAK